MQVTEHKIQLKSRSDCFYLIPLGDIHLGTKNCDEEKLEKIIQYIKVNKNVYWIGMGDYIEAINYIDKRFDPANLHPRFQNKLDNLVTAQMQYVADLFNPIKKRCIGLLEGNHEETIRKDFQMSPVDYLAGALNVKNLGYVCMIRLTVCRPSTQKIIVYATHGFGAGRYAGGKVNNLLSIGKDFDADIYLAGHTHEKVGIDRDRLVMTLRGEPRLYAKKQLYAITGSFFKTYQQDSKAYTEKKGYPPTPTGVVKIKIEPFRNERINNKDVDLPAHYHISE